MKDFVNPDRDIKTLELMKMANAAEARPKELFNMGNWVFEVAGCGTAGCLCGTYVMDVLRESYSVEGLQMRASHIANSFGLSVLERQFLFTGHRYEFQSAASSDAQNLTQQQAINRLRKFLYYKMRKAELLEDYEEARKMSDINVTVGVELKLEAAVHEQRAAV